MLRRILPAAILAGLVLGPTQSAQSAVTVFAVPANQVVSTGGSGYFVDVFMISDTADSLAAFNVRIDTPAAAGITFTGGNDSVATYVFTGNTSGIIFGNPGGPNTADLNDVAFSGTQPIAAFTAYGLGRFFFSVAVAAPHGVVPITLNAATSFTRPDFSAISYASATPLATLTVVPEPSTFALGGACVVVGGLGWYRRRQRRRQLA